MAYFDIKAATAEMVPKKQIILTFLQLLNLSPPIQIDQFECHPDINNVVGLLSNSLGRFIALEVNLAEQGIELLSIREPAYEVDISNVGYIES